MTKKIISDDFSVPSYKQDVNYAQLCKELESSMSKHLDELKNHCFETNWMQESIEYHSGSSTELNSEMKPRRRRSDQELKKEESCPYRNCEKCYSTKASLKLHIKRRHKSTDELKLVLTKPFPVTSKFKKGVNLDRVFKKAYVGKIRSKAGLSTQESSQYGEESNISQNDQALSLLNFSAEAKCDNNASEQVYAKKIANSPFGLKEEDVVSNYSILAKANEEEENFSETFYTTELNDNNLNDFLNEYEKKDENSVVEELFFNREDYQNVIVENNSLGDIDFTLNSPKLRSGKRMHSYSHRNLTVELAYNYVDDCKSMFEESPTTRIDYQRDFQKMVSESIALEAGLY